MTRKPIIRVVKVGGSLLDWPDLPAALKNWLADEPPALNILVCGCGPFGDHIRQAQQRFHVGDEAAHWLCVDLLSVTARLLSAILPSAGCITAFHDLRRLTANPSPDVIVFDAAQFLRDYEAALPGEALPHNWSVTTDSIAARLATALTADELVLLKSASPPAGDTIDVLASGGYVDRFFSSAAQSVKALRYVNLRES